MLPTSPVIVIDIGAAGSLISLGWLDPVCEIHGFEPRPEGTPRSDPRYASVHIHNVGLAATAGTHKLYVTREPMASSLRPPNPEVTKRYYRPNIFDVVGETAIDCQTLDGLAKANIIPSRVDYLKIDTQGSEYDILRGGRNLLRQTSIVTCETEFVQLYKDQPLFADVAGELANAGFRFINFTDGETIRGKRIWADALFAKPATDSEHAVRMAEIMVALGQVAAAEWMLHEHAVSEPTIKSIKAYAPTPSVIGKLREFNHQRRVDGKLHYDGRRTQQLIRKLTSAFGH
jgi:FkbM family methyltransferase